MCALILPIVQSNVMFGSFSNDFIGALFLTYLLHLAGSGYG